MSSRARSRVGLGINTGGWVVRLTDAPLDLDNPAHLDALRRAYERLPKIGGRSSPLSERRSHIHRPWRGQGRSTLEHAMAAGS
ncbi:DUF5953 family protein [Archangium sp.]|uniref:DUF5953 family protein n=1 Tax=Archangium sp. TaxID=1872627 RepID=UPI002D7029DF|nr:DUF5953 family protein [Archangium sp.]HYO54362.1 DUF5953 family protein [Archangium sp.]